MIKHSPEWKVTINKKFTYLTTAKLIRTATSRAICRYTREHNLGQKTRNKIKLIIEIEKIPRGKII